MIELTTSKGHFFYTRKDTSDYKTIDEVVKRDSYQKRYFKIEKGENWIDLGANIGAFTVLARSLGADVTCYEPDPDTYAILKKNLAVNGIEESIAKNIAVIGNDMKEISFFRSKTNQHWRNSAVKDWGGERITVSAKSFGEVVKDGDCVKMDIEGAEMEIIEKMDVNLKMKKLVLEWSFDMDDNINRYRRACLRLEKMFDVVKYNKINEKHNVWQKSWFPPAKMIYCYNN